MTPRTPKARRRYKQRLAGRQGACTCTQVHTDAWQAAEEASAGLKAGMGSRQRAMQAVGSGTRTRPALRPPPGPHRCSLAACSLPQHRGPPAPLRHRSPGAQEGPTRQRRHRGPHPSCHAAPTDDSPLDITCRAPSRPRPAASLKAQTSCELPSWQRSGA